MLSGTDIDTYIKVKDALEKRKKGGFYSWKLYENDDIIKRMDEMISEEDCFAFYEFSYDDFFTVYVTLQTPKDESEYLEDFEIGSSKDGIRMDELKRLNILTPSVFGYKGQTVSDENVRKCLEITKEHGLEISEDATLALQEKISNFLFGNDVFIHISKLCIYEEGGHFDTHTDTIKAKSHIGTLVILLPNKHTGGEFQIRQPFSDEDAFRSVQKNCIYFSRDCPHRVLRVTSGVRAALIFDVYCESDCYRNSDCCFEERFRFTHTSRTGEEDGEEEKDDVPVSLNNNERVALVLAKEMKRMYDEFKMAGSKTSIAVQMRHTYLRSINVASLYGYDRSFYKALQFVFGTDHPITLVPLIVFGFGESTVKIQELNPLGISDVLFIPIGTLLSIEKQSAIEYTGNEAQEAEYTCFTCAFLIHNV